MKTRIIAGALALTALSAWAEDISTLDGRKFSTELISSVEPDGLKITTSDGIEKIPFANLSEEIQRKYGYEPAKAAQFKRALTAAAVQRVSSQEADKRGRKVNDLMEQAKMKMTAKINQITDSGALVMASVEYEATEEQQVDGGSVLVKSVAIHREKVVRQAAFAEPVFVYGVPRDLVDGDSWSGNVWPAGVFRYPTVGGSEKTVRAFATDKLAALKLLSK